MPRSHFSLWNRVYMQVVNTIRRANTSPYAHTPYFYIEADSIPPDDGVHTHANTITHTHMYNPVRAPKPTEKIPQKTISYSSRLRPAFFVRFLSLQPVCWKFYRFFPSFRVRVRLNISGFSCCLFCLHTARHIVKRRLRLKMF